MKRVISILVLMLCISEISFALSKEEGKPTAINVEVGKVSEVVFPDNVAKVVKGGEPNSILVEVLDNSLYILPKSENPADIFVTTSSGISYPLSLHLSKERDIKVQVGPVRKPSFSTNKTYSDVMGLMKDLLLQKELPMATNLNQKGQVILSNGNIQLTIDKAYELGSWKAYVLKARNISRNAVIIPIEQMILPNLLAVSADQDNLSSLGQEGDSTNVYMVVGQ